MTPEEREALTPELISDYISELECVVITRYPDSGVVVEYGDSPIEVAVYLLNRALNVLMGNEDVEPDGDYDWEDEDPEDPEDNEDEE